MIYDTIAIIVHLGWGEVLEEGNLNSDGPLSFIVCDRMKQFVYHALLPQLKLSPPSSIPSIHPS